jgi:tRNA (guanine26-N2/guanine27-N2)-dimethyltransferase
MTSTTSTTKDDSTVNSNDDTTTTTTTITEGSATMTFPSSKESTVFYNPVQVQNRDLSILMISLYAERRAVRNVVRQKRKELLQGKRQLRQEDLDQLQAFEASLDPMELVKQHQTQQQQQQQGEGTQGGLTILEALAASGLRSVRYWKEIAGVQHVTINDLELAAIERAKDNLHRNNLDDVLLDSNETRAPGICVNHGDATHELYLARRPQRTRDPTPTQQKQQPMWDVIDLDPYGSAAPFLDGAVQAVESGGLLCVTCTDMAALGGSHPETAYGRYAALPIQSARYLQELALRILLHTIAVSAARYGRTIRPVLSVGMAFYVRVFVEIHNDKQGVQDLSVNIGHVYQSTKCGTFTTLPHGQMGGRKGNVYQSIRLDPSVCPETGAPFKVGGPLWLGPLHDQTVVTTALERLAHESGSSPQMELLATRKRLTGLLTTVSEEIDTPLYYTVPDLARVLNISCPPLQKAKAAILNAGYQVSGFHKEPEALKTNAPSRVVWDVMRAWAKENPPKNALPEDSAGAKIMATPPSIQVDFTIPESMLKHKKQTSNVSRFPQNPEKHWGPKRKAISSKIPSNQADVNDSTQKEQHASKDGQEDADGEPPVKRRAPASNDDGS